MSELKERPILFSGEMVRAILEGRKTQTRRIVKNLKAYPDRWVWKTDKYSTMTLPVGEALGSPFGKPGDRLWVRETWGWFTPNWDGIEWVPDRPYRRIRELKVGKGYADGNLIWRADGEFTWAKEDSMEEVTCWHPSIHMPRKASRIDLEITNVRVERLQDISEDDAVDEGVSFESGWEEPLGEGYTCGSGYLNYQSENDAYEFGTAKESFRSLWNKINGATSWEHNPWVWAIEFKRVQ